MGDCRRNSIEIPKTLGPTPEESDLDSLLGNRVKPLLLCHRVQGKGLRRWFVSSQEGVRLDGEDRWSLTFV
jgi:hypothetical protein